MVGAERPMLKIRRIQLEVFDRAVLKQFENDMIAHLQEFSPAHARGVGEDGLLKVIRCGVERARWYGFTLRGSVRFYIELMVQYGSDFDTDPVLPWASFELRNQTNEPELERADRVHAAAMEYRDAVIGTDYEVEIAAIRRLLRTPIDRWLADDLSDRALEARLRHLHPAKCERAGSRGLMAIIAAGRETARALRLPMNTGGVVMTALMFAFGHGVWTDPQYGWIPAVLAETAEQSPWIQVETLAVRVLTYLRVGLRLLEGP